jgi:hypothetical protein
MKKSLIRDPLYKVGITIKNNPTNKTYTMCFNGTDRGLTINLPVLGNMLSNEHAILVLRSFGIRVTNYVHNDNGDYVLIVPMTYWNQVRELFLKVNR